MTKQDVREFYDNIGWSQVGEGVYQNARYEDLREVSREYIHKCHLRINRHIQPEGTYLLDVGSGPIQYDEYLTYSKGYKYRVCADISFTAMMEARKKIRDHGLFVVADVANLPFKKDAFDGIVTLHTIHHIPQSEHIRAYEGLYRILKPGRSAAVVNGWRFPPLMYWINSPIRWRKALRQFVRRIRGVGAPPPKEEATGTFINKYDSVWLKGQLKDRMHAEIRVWRSVNVHFLRFYIHKMLGGRFILKIIFALEERFPHFFGEKGAYPLVVLEKEAR